MTSLVGDREPALKPLAALLPSLACAAVGTQRLFDGHQAQALEVYTATVARALGRTVGPMSDDATAAIDALLEALAPAHLHLASLNVGMTLVSTMSKEHGFALEVLPLNLGYVQRYGLTRRQESHISFTVVPLARVASKNATVPTPD